MSRLTIGLICISLLVTTPLYVAWGEDAIIKGVSIADEGGTVSVNFAVENCFSKKMEEAIRAGVPTTFNFYVSLYRKRAVIWDKKVASHVFHHRLVYDNLKEEFRIWLQEKGKEIRVTELEEAKRAMQQVEGFAVAKSSDMGAGEYELAIKVKLDPVRLPLRLEGILFFVSLWDFETDWYYRTVRVEK